MDLILIKTNEYLTPITLELLDLYPDEVLELFMDFINTVPLILNMISPDRPYVKDLPRDAKGRAIVDITNPPIVEDADYFRLSALYFLKHKCYTKLRPNSNPNSEYRKFWDRELDRCYDGLLRESDGMWIPGYLYWFLNYNPMMINVYEEGRRKAVRKESFGLFFEGIWWRFLYLNNARENGHHAIELAKRGAHPYFLKVYTPDGIKNWGDINIGDYLYDSKGGVTKVTDIPFDAVAPYYKVTLRDGREVLASSDHLWEVEVYGRKDLNILSTEELLSIYKRQRKISYRNPEGVEYICKILSNKGVEFKYEKTKVDPYTFGLLLGDGCFRHKSCYYSQSEDDLNNQKSFIPYDVIKWKTYCGYRINIPNWNNILKGYNLYNAKSIDKFIPDEYKYNSRQVRLDILKGLFDTDGTSNKGVPEFYTISEKLKDDVIFIARSLGYNASYSVKKTSYNTDNGRIKCNPVYTIVVYAGEEIFNLNRKKETIKYLNNRALSRVNGTMITDILYIGNTKCKCVTVDSEDSCYLIGDFVKTHNCGKSYSLSTIMSHNLILGESREANRRCITVLTAYQKEYLKDDKDGTLNKFTPELAFLSNNTPFPRLMLKQSAGDMSWLMGYKDEYGRNQGSLNQVMGVSAKDDSDKLRGKRGWILFEEMGSFLGLLELYDVTRKSVEDGDYTFACMYLVGTANNKESNFLSAKTLLYAPGSYNIQLNINVYDKRGKGKSVFGFFFPSYINRAGCYDKDGNSDVVKALLLILLARHKAKYGADPTSVLRVIAEDPITPAEAIIKVKNAYFNVAALSDRAQLLDSNPRLYDDIYIGDIIKNSDGKTEFKLTDETPIRKFPVDNDTKGALEIYSLPEKDRSGKVFANRYIIGVDPYDNDLAESHSLYSIYVFDLFTDTLVAEYTGRTDYANDAHNKVLMLCLYYNAKALYESNKKGLFGYALSVKLDYLLADTPQFLRDKLLVKYSSFGSSQKGVNASAAINNYANSLIKDWLNKLVTVMVKNDEGEEIPTEIPRLYTLKNRALIEEAILFTPEINVDRIRALGMVMLYRQLYIIDYGGDLNIEAQERVNSNYEGNDEFFTKNYDNRFLSTKTVNLA